MTWGCSWGLDTSPPQWTHTMKLSACGKENHSYSCFTLRHSNIWLSENLDLQFLTHKVICEMSCKLFSDGVCFSSSETCFICDSSLVGLWSGSEITGTHWMEDRWSCHNPVHLHRQGSRSIHHTTIAAEDTPLYCRQTDWDHMSLEIKKKPHRRGL